MWSYQHVSLVRPCIRAKLQRTFPGKSVTSTICSTNLHKRTKNVNSSLSCYSLLSLYPHAHIHTSLCGRELAGGPDAFPPDLRWVSKSWALCSQCCFTQLLKAFHWSGVTAVVNCLEINPSACKRSHEQCTGQVLPLSYGMDMGTAAPLLLGGSYLSSQR